MSWDDYYDFGEGGDYTRPSHYPPGYRDDEEMYVYDQCCDNCEQCVCPLEEDDDDSIGERKHKERLRKEDGAFRDGELIWCIHWKGGCR